MKNHFRTMSIVSTFLLLVFHFFCSEAPKNIIFDFYEEFEHAQKTIPKNDIDPVASWNLHFRWNGWRKNQGFEKDAILIPNTQQTAFLDFQVINKQNLTINLILKSFLPVERKNAPQLVFFMNGHPVHRTALDSQDYQPIQFDVSHDRLFIGKNLLKVALSFDPKKIQTPYWLALKKMQIIESMPTENRSPLLLEEAIQAQTIKSFLSKRKALKQRANTSLNYHVFIPRESHLVFGYSLNNPTDKPHEDTEFSVYIETETNDSKILYTADIKKMSPRRTHLEIDLSAYEGKIVKISYCFLQPSQTIDTGAELILWEPKIFGMPWNEEHEKNGEGQETFTQPFNILIYLIDCLRPDHLPFFGYEKNTSPFMTIFAEDSIVFRNSYAQSSWTKPSIGTLFTGLHPSLHQSITQSSGLFPQLETMAEALKKAGYQTAGISSNPSVKEYYDFHQGFDFFQFHGNLKGGSAEKLNEYIFPWLKKTETPFFLFVHTMDVHRPYFLEDEFLPPGVDDPIYADSPVVKSKKGFRRKEYDVVLEHRIAEYDAAIQQNDKSFGNLIAELKKKGLYEDTMIILMSDHGEELYDHGKFGHGPTLYQEVIQNVLVIKMPDQLMAGKEIQQNIQEIDLFPTLLDLTGEPIPSYLPGRSIKQMLISDIDSHLPFYQMIYIEAPLNTRKKALVMDHWKMIHTGAQWRNSPFEWELYDLEKDPDEKINIANKNLIVSEYMKRKFILWVEAQEKLRSIRRDDVEKNLTEKDIEELRALGYIR